MLSEINKIIKWLAQHQEDDLTIVGGQAIALWEQYFGLESRVQTEDIDLLGGVENAEKIAAVIGGQFRIATIDDFTVNSAVVTKNGVEVVDFLDFVKGIDEDQLLKRRIQIKPSIGGTLFLQHPLDCLRGKIANYFEIPNKRNLNGMNQITSAILVCKSYLKSLLEERDEKEAINITNAILSMATKDRVKRLCLIENIDILNAIPSIGRFSTELFRDENYPRQIKIIKEKRVKYNEFLKRHGNTQSRKISNKSFKTDN